MSIKAGAQQPVDDALKGLDFIQAIIALSKNPKSVEEMKQTLIEANTISEQRKVEADEAAKNITAAQLALAKLEEVRIAHEVRVSETATALEKREALVGEKADKLVADTVAAKKEIDAQFLELEHQRKDVEKNCQLADKRHNEVDARTNDLNAFESSLNRREQQIAEREKKHDERVAKFNARKKTLADAAKEAGQED